MNTTTTHAEKVRTIDSMPPGHRINAAGVLEECPCWFCEETYHAPQRTGRETLREEEM